jgi:hypothetical protein
MGNETMETPREVIAKWLWNEADQIDFDDMGDQAGMAIVSALDKAGYMIVPKAPRRDGEQEPRHD